MVLTARAEGGWNATRRARPTALAAEPTSPEVTQDEQHDEDDHHDDDYVFETHNRLLRTVRTLCGPNAAAS